MTSYSLTTTTGKPIDQLLDEIFESKENGFFIELGAHDGLTQSNTAFFEFHRGWKGVLIEPSQSAFKLCVESRPNSFCFNKACVSNTFSDEYVEGDFNGKLMSSVNGMRINNCELMKVQASTLEAILDSIKPPSIDFLSIDTEGYEYEVLCGLNLRKYRPTYILIEVYITQYDLIIKFLEENNYKLVCNLTNYNTVNNCLWDGTHNDYLFVDIS